MEREELIKALKDLSKEYDTIDDAIEALEYHDPRFPIGYAEVEYEDFDSPEAIEGAKFDDMMFLHYYER